MRFLALLIFSILSVAHAQNFDTIEWRRDSWVEATGSIGINAFTLNESGDRFAYAINPPETITVEQCCFRQTARTGTPTSYRLGIQAIDASTGSPDGSYIQSGTFTPGSGTQNQCVTFTGVSVVKNSGRACVLQSESGVDGSNNIAVASRASGFTTIGENTVWTKDGAAAWVKPGAANYAPGWYKTATRTYGYPVYNDSSGFIPDGTEWAFRFILPSTACSTAKITGSRIATRMNSAANMVVKIYSGGGVGDTTAIHTSTINSRFIANADGAARSALLPLDSPVTVNCGEYYRISYSAPGGSSLLEVKGVLVPANADMEAFNVGGSEWYFSSRTTGNWTNQTDRALLATLVFGEITAPVGGGGGLKNHNNASGGAQ